MGSLAPDAPHPCSAAAFVEGGVQDPCEESCSICLESFCDSNPATVTSCKHEYHLQCVLEWSQRSKECPMCWQPLSLKDPNSQELLEAVEQERSYRQNRQFSTVFQRTPLEDFDIRNVPAYADDSDFEERIMQHLAAAAIGRAHHFSRRESLRSRPSNGQGHPQFVVVPTHPNSSPAPPLSGTVHSGANLPASVAVGPVPPAGVGSPDQLAQPVNPVVQNGSVSVRASRSPTNFVPTGEINRNESYSLRSRTGLEPVQENQQRTGPSEFQSFSESLKSRFAAASSRYKESFSKTTKGFRERLRARNGAMTDLGVRAREVSAGVVRALERISLESMGKNGGESHMPAPSDSASGMEGCSTLTQAAPGSESGGEPQINPRTFVIMDGNSASAHASGVCASKRVAPQPPNNELYDAFEGDISKVIEGSSGGGSHVDHDIEEGEVQRTTAVSSST